MYIPTLTALLRFVKIFFHSPSPDESASRLPQNSLLWPILSRGSAPDYWIAIAERNLVEGQGSRFSLVAHLGVVYVHHPPQCACVKNEITGRDHPFFVFYQNSPANEVAV